MATIDMTAEKTLVITNTLKAEGDIFTDAPSGRKVIMTLADALEGKYQDIQYVLDANGNFAYYEDGKVKEIEVKTVSSDATTVNSIDKTKLAVVVKRDVKLNDRFVQFYRTQQQIKLEPADELKVKVTTAAEYAYYMGLNGNGISVKESA